MFKHIQQTITNLSLKMKILAIIVMVNIFLIGTISIFSINIIVNANNNILYKSIASSLSYSATDIEDTLDQALTISNIMIADDVIQTQLSLIKDTDDIIIKSKAFKSLYTTIGSYYLQSKKIHINYITLTNDTFTSSTYIPPDIKVTNEIKDQLIYSAIAKEGAPDWTTKYIGDYGLFLSRAIRKIDNLNLSNLGILSINLDFNKIIEDSTKFSNQYEASYYILFDENRLMYHSDALSSSNAMDIKDQLNKPYGIITLSGNKYFAVKGILPNFKWDYICLVSYEKTYKAIMFSYFAYVLVILLSVILSIFLSSRLISLITKHFDNLMNKMKVFRGQSSERIDVGYDYSSRGDEFGVLHRQFDSMASEIQALIQDKYIHELLIKDAKFKALETQMNPHFLYNILESVNWRAKAIGEKQISLMVESLGRLLRATLNENDDDFTLKRELELVEYYMIIQQLRFEEQLQFEVNVDERFLNAKIPKLVLQPLVENAIAYGLEQNTDTCLIKIDVTSNTNHLILCVSNSGSQFEDRILEKLSTHQIKPHGLGIGILNIHNRIKITFGDPYGLTFYNETDMAVAMITMPYLPLQ